jgi:DNA-3-methyladenine glycosylase I
MKDKIRCSWCSNDQLYKNYHDIEWGVPISDDNKLFEFLILEIFQAGLSWYTVLKKRKNFIYAFDKFDLHKISIYDNKKIETLMLDKGIIRNRLKITSTIMNAKNFIEIQKKHGSFYKYLLVHKKNSKLKEHLDPLNNFSPMALKICKDLKKKGFKFIGPKIIYSYLMATGVINGHQKNCYRYLELNS